MIMSSAAAAPTLAEEDRVGRTKSRGVDPHSSLALFTPREVHTREESLANSVAPRESAKPPPREWNDLFAGEESQQSPERSQSPTKRERENSNPLKSGAGKHYHEPRLFDNNKEDEEAVVLKEKGIKTNAQKYNHFEFGEAEFKPPASVDPSKPKNKHLSQWDFQDFVTPEKPRARKLAHHQPSFKWDEVEAEAPKSPVYLEHVPRPRPDADAHFQFEEDTPKPQRTVSNRPASTQGGLYEDHVLGAYHTSLNRNTIGNGNGAETDDGHDDMPLKSITNPNQHQHNKTFSSHWEMKDPSPAAKESTQNNENARPLINQKVRGQDSHFSLFEDTAPLQERGIKIHGDGMGKRKQGEKNWWEYDE